MRVDHACSVWKHQPSLCTHLIRCRSCKAGCPTKMTRHCLAFLGGGTDYTVALDCTDAGALPRIIDLRGPTAHEEYWSWKKTAYQSQYFGPNGPAAPLTVKSFDLLRQLLKPDALSAIGARFRRMSSTDSPDDTIVFDLTMSRDQRAKLIPLRSRSRSCSIHRSRSQRGRCFWRAVRLDRVLAAHARGGKVKPTSEVRSAGSCSAVS